MPMGEPPKLSPEERAVALAKAAAARRIRANLKSQVKEGSTSIKEVIELAARDSVIGKMRTIELLESIPGVGKIRAVALMDRLGISLPRRLKGLGKHQKTALLQEFGFQESKRGHLIVLSGPGGVGKSTVAARLREIPDFWVSISATTRQPRMSEEEGVDYYFLTDLEFDQKIADDEFLEWASFAGARYGTPRKKVESALANGQSVLLEIEIDGAMQVKNRSSEALLVFLQPPSWEILVSRLEKRGSDTPSRRAERLELAKNEIAAGKNFDFMIINDEVQNVVDKLVSFLTLERP